MAYKLITLIRHTTHCQYNAHQFGTYNSCLHNVHMPNQHLLNRTNNHNHNHNQNQNHQDQDEDKPYTTHESHANPATHGLPSLPKSCH